MRRRFIPALICCSVFAGIPAIVNQVHLLVASGDLVSARRELKQFRDAKGTTPEYLEALSWIGRGELALRNFPAAEQNSGEVRKLCLDQTAHRKLDADSSLPTALGASIEVEALALAIQGRRDEAVLFLRDEARRWHDTSILPRIQKNLNLLTLEGKPAPPLETSVALTGRKLQTLAQHRGHPVLLFFWAHWCSDCKQEIAIVEQLEAKFARRGLVVIAPTQHYGYVAGGLDAAPAIETKYIREVFARYYAGLGPVEIPLSERNFTAWGVSTTPTLALVDSQGIVRLYNPGTMAYGPLASRIEALLLR